MNPATLAIVLQLINTVTAAATALQAVSRIIEQAKAEGRDVTIDDLKVLQLDDDAASEALVLAIESAENT